MTSRFNNGASCYGPKSDLMLWLSGLVLFGLGNVDYNAFSGEMPVQNLVSQAFQKMVLLLKAGTGFS